MRKLSRDEVQHLSISGLTATAKALYLVLLWQAVERPLLVIVDGAKQAEILQELIGTFFDLLASGRDAQRPQTIPALDVLPHQNLSPHSEISEQRAIGLWRLSTREVPITLAPIQSALLRTESRDFYRQLALTLRVGEELAIEDIMAHLRSIGYEKRDPVEMVGEYSVRGGILDVFPAESPQPVRIEFFGDLIESMRRFDVESQRSVLQIKETALLPLLEYPKSREVLHEIAELRRRARGRARRGVPGLGVLGAGGAAACGLALAAWRKTRSSSGMNGSRSRQRSRASVEAPARARQTDRSSSRKELLHMGRVAGIAGSRTSVNLPGTRV